MISDIGDSLLDLPEANELFRHHILTNGLSFVKLLEKVALEDAETCGDETIAPCMGVLAKAVGRMSPRELRQLNLFSLADFGLSHRAMHCFTTFVARVDKLLQREGAEIKIDKLSDLVTKEVSTCESYDDDFEDQSSPEKSDTGISELDPGSPMRKRPPRNDGTTTGNPPVKRNSRTSSPSRARDREWIAKGSWKIGEKIGQGSFGEVFKCLNNSGKLFAVKRMHISAGQSEEMLNLANEIDLMRNMSHPNIVSYIGTKVDMEKEAVFIFQEWVSGGSVVSMLVNFGPFELDVVRTYTIQILSGLEYLHDNGIVHRDIKGGNILIENSGGVKLADFGASTKVALGDTQQSEAVRGTPYFSPPENLCETKYGRKGDIWAVGCTVVEMLTGHPPWQSDTVTTVVQLYMHIVSTNGPPPIVGRELPDDAEEFLACIFKIDPKLRPGAKDLQAHPFLSPDNYEDSLETSSYGGSSVGSNIYGSSSVDLLRLREVEVWKASNRNVSSGSPPNGDRGNSKTEVAISTGGGHTTNGAVANTANYRQKAQQKGLKADTATATATTTTISNLGYSFQCGNRVEARLAGLAKWLPGIIRGCELGGQKFTVEYDSGNMETAIDGSMIRLVTTNGGNMTSPSRGDPRGASPSGNPFARPSFSPGAAVVNPFGRIQTSPLPSVLKSSSVSPNVDKRPHQQEIVLTNWDAVYSSESGSELPSPFKNTSSNVSMVSPILSGKARAARTAPGQCRGQENAELFPEAALAKKESRRDVRTAGNIPDTVKERRPAGGERRKGSRRAAGKVARAVSEHTLAPDPTSVISRHTNNRIGPAQILREARKDNSSDAKGNHSMSSITIADDDYSSKIIKDKPRRK